MSIPWLSAYSKNRNLSNILTRTLLLTLLLFVPPLGYFIWMQPITCAGILFPGFGWLGFSLTILLMLKFVALRFSQSLSSSTKKCLIFMTTAMLLLSLYANLNYQTPLAPKSWLAINTHLGPAPQNYFNLAKREFTLIALAAQALNHGKKVIILPENIAANWLPGTQSQWQAVTQEARNQNANIILGTQLDYQDQSHDNVLMVLGKAANHIYPARQPMPLGLWRPWSKNSYRIHWFSSGKFSLQGHVVAYLICYEDMVPWPIFSSWISKPYPDLIISPANQWFAMPSGYLKQQNIMLANARLFKLPILTAVNR